MKKYIKAILLTAIIAITLVPLGVLAEEIGTAGHQFEIPQWEILQNEYSIIDDWDGTGSPIENGWFEYEGGYFKAVNGEIVLRDRGLPSELTGEKGQGYLLIELELEDGNEGDFGVRIVSEDGGARATLYLTKLNGYKAHIKHLPGGTYSVLNIFPAHSQLQVPTDLINYPEDFTIIDGKQE